MKKSTAGFSLIEILVTISIIGVLSSILYATYNDAREQARDKIRMTSLKELQVAIELYKAQNGRYPEQGCGTVGSQFAGPRPNPGPSPESASFSVCSVYIKNLTPDFISTLPLDPKTEGWADNGFYYRTNSDGSSYKLMVYNSVETLYIKSWGDEFARCPVSTGGSGACPGEPTGLNNKTRTYAVYSKGAENW